MRGGRVAVFLDRDGTINEEKDFLRSPDELRLIPGAALAVRKLNECGVPTCIISNQSGIARGFLTEDTLRRIHEKLEGELRGVQARVDRIYYCPHHPTEGMGQYRVECECRKPRPGMLRRGELELQLDLTRSFVVGDSLVDLQAGAAVGASTILVLTGYGQKTLEACKAANLPMPHVAATVVEAVDFILKTIIGADAIEK